MIVIYGASGHTGTLIAQALAGQELDFVMAGRDEERLRQAAAATGAETRVAALADDEALFEIFQDADVVINCAGPFGSLGEPVVRAALKADCHYLDTTGEQSFVRFVYENYEAQARKSQRVIVNACAFEIALGDWAAHVAAKGLDCETADSIEVSYAIENMRPSKGTQLSILEALSQPGFMWDTDRWIAVAPGTEQRHVDFPPPFGPRAALSFPSAEVITIPRHAPALKVQTFLSLAADSPITRAAGLIAPFVSPLVTPLLGSLLRTSIGAIAKSTIESADPSAVIDNDATRFALIAEASFEDQRSVCAITGANPYAITAGIACLGAERLQNEGELCGVLAPSQLLEPRDALEEIAEQYDLLLECP